MNWEIISSREDFITLEEDWKRLEHESDNKNISVSFEWCSLWWKTFKHKEDNTFGYNKQLKIVVVRTESGEIKLICPLVLLKRKVFRLNLSFLEFLGQQWGATTYSYLKLNNEQISFDEILNFCRENIMFDVLYLRNIPKSANGTYGNRLTVNAGCPQINLEHCNGYEKLYSSFPKNLRQNIRTAYNRAVKQGCKLSLDIITPDAVDWNEIIKVSKSKMNDGKYSLYEDADKKIFFTQIAKRLDSNFVLAKIDENIISYRYNILYHGNKFCIDASYDRNFPQYNLGALTVARNIEDSCDRKLDLHSMGPGCYDYKLKFTSAINYLGYLVSHSNTTKSKLISKLFFYFLQKKRCQL